MSKPWTPEERELLRQLYPTMETAHLAQQMQRTTASINNQAYLMRLKKVEGWMQQFGRRVYNAGKATQFKKGNIPANKGKKTPEHVVEKLRPTMFKKGNLPHNTKHDGAITTRTDNKGNAYKYIRLAQGKWRELHRHIWEQHHGAVPAGYNVQFRDGNRMNCSIDNLYIIPRTQQAQVNYHGGNKLPQQLQETILLTNQLNTKIKAYEKQN